MTTRSTTPRPAHTWCPPFPVTGNELQVGGVTISRLAQRVGQTPFYAYDRALILQRVQTLTDAFHGRIAVHYAVKANPMPALACMLAEAVDGFDVASAGELSIALDAGMPPARISFAGPGKGEAELSQAVAAGIVVNIESMREIVILERLSQTMGCAARVAVRVNPDFELKSAGMKMGGGPKPFGIDAEQVPEALRAIARSGLAFEGFHLFAGSQNLRAAALLEAQTKSYELARQLSQHAPSAPKSINLGGGFGLPYFPGDQALDIDTVTANLLSLADQAARDLPGTRLAIELGRYLVGEAGVYVCKIVDSKVSRGQRFLVVDGGLHHHLAASGNFGQVVRRNYPTAIGNKMGAADVEEVSVVGLLCTPLDLLADRVLLPRAAPGDYFVIFLSGAYGASASPQGFLGHPRPAEVLV
ncbi:MAG: hypothetical protein RJA63_373 [Pseudomonadota bacterium]|nr:pyridoxal-dependent decarboxylase, exosortase A system-associated [Uliginosibacterium sp.]